MIECKICGHRVKYRLIDHIQKTHKMNIESYKKEYGEVTSDEYKEKTSRKMKEKWKIVERRQFLLCHPVRCITTGYRCN